MVLIKQLQNEWNIKSSYKEYSTHNTSKNKPQYSSIVQFLSALTHRNDRKKITCNLTIQIWPPFYRKSQVTHLSYLLLCNKLSQNLVAWNPDLFFMNLWVYWDQLGGSSALCGVAEDTRVNFTQLGV